MFLCRTRKLDLLESCLILKPEFSDITDSDSQATESSFWTPPDARVWFCFQISLVFLSLSSITGVYSLFFRLKSTNIKAGMIETMITAFMMMGCSFPKLYLEMLDWILFPPNVKNVQNVTDPYRYPLDSSAGHIKEYKAYQYYGWKDLEYLHANFSQSWAILPLNSFFIFLESKTIL